jgi:hypothetical protein
MYIGMEIFSRTLKHKDTLIPPSDYLPSDLGYISQNISFAGIV